MPLPINGTKWPPPPYDHVQDKYSEWAAWYGGLTDDLAQLYGGIAGGGVATKYQFFGGVVGRLARFFWGTPPSRGSTTSSKLHIPMAEEIAAQGSYALFKDPPLITTGSEPHQARIDQYINEGLFTQLLEGAEVASALSGVYFRVGYDMDLSEYPLLSVVHPDRAVPDFYFGHMTGVIIWNILSDVGGEVIRHLELHEPGTIQHALYYGDHKDIGNQEPLDKRPETEFLPEGEIPGPVPGLDVVYVPNLRTRIWRDKGAAANLGRSDYGSVISIMDALDEAYTSWMRDVRLGKARLMVPQQYLETEGRGKGAVFDLDKDVFVGLDVMGAKEVMQITPSQFAIRHIEHKATCDTLMERILAGSGYSLQTFGMTGDVAMTATESDARERRTFDTRAAKVEVWKRKVKCLVELMLGVDAVMGNVPAFVATPDTEILVEFPPAVQEDQLTLANVSQFLRQAEAASTDTLVRLNHPDWDDERVDAEVALIIGEKPAPPVVIDPTKEDPTAPAGAADPVPPDLSVPTGAGL